MRWLLPGVSLICLVAAPPGPTELGRSTYVLPGTITPEALSTLKSLRITCVIDLRRDDEPGFDGEKEARALGEIECGYARVAVGREPKAEDFDNFRMIRNSLPKECRVAVHCANGNRAAALVCAWAVSDMNMARDKALARARQAGMANAGTERALLAYLDRGKG